MRDTTYEIIPGWWEGGGGIRKITAANLHRPFLFALQAAGKVRSWDRKEGA
jgi:hypothetical protein